MFKTFSLDIIESNLSKLKPLKYNKFYWWRKWGPKHKPNPSLTLQKRIKNGDFEYSPYYWQLQYCEYEINQKYIKFRDPVRFLEETKIDRIRRKKLIEDYERDEIERIETLKKLLLKEFHFSKETLEKELEEFDDNIEKFYIYCNNKFCKKL